MFSGDAGDLQRRCRALATTDTRDGSYVHEVLEPRRRRACSAVPPDVLAPLLHEAAHAIHCPQHRRHSRP